MVERTWSEKIANHFTFKGRPSAFFPLLPRYAPNLYLLPGYDSGKAEVAPHN
jgi:hypothetical protein